MPDYIDPTNPSNITLSTIEADLGTPTGGGLAQFLTQKYITNVQYNLSIPYTTIFAEALAKASASQGGLTLQNVITNFYQLINTTPPADLTKTGLYQALAGDYYESRGSSVSSNGTITGDLALLNGSMSGTWDSTNSTFNANDPAANFLQQILLGSTSSTSYSSNLASDITTYNNDQSAGNTAATFNDLTKLATDFQNDWDNSLTVSATLGAVSVPAGKTNPFSSLGSYQTEYILGSGGQSQQQFASDLQSFYTQEMNQYGYFDPSHMFSDWKTYLQNKYPNGVVVPTGSAPLDANDSYKVSIMNRLIFLLISIIQSIQSVGVAQANHLQYLTNYQNAYTSLQSQMPVFLQTGGSDSAPIYHFGTDAQNARNDLNANFNGNLTDNLRALRSVLEDKAKQEQSNLDATNNASNQEADMCTTLIQQLSSLLTTIIH